MKSQSVKFGIDVLDIFHQITNEDRGYFFLGSCFRSLCRNGNYSNRFIYSEKTGEIIDELNDEFMKKYTNYKKYGNIWIKFFDKKVHGVILYKNKFFDEIIEYHDMSYIFDLQTIIKELEKNLFRKYYYNESGIEKADLEKLTKNNYKNDEENNFCESENEVKTVCKEIDLLDCEDE
ncbi:MAG: hypothetical protein ABIJ17_02455 [Patescibacteria group bacterium]